MSDDNIIPFTRSPVRPLSEFVPGDYVAFVCPACETDGFGFDVECKINSRGKPIISALVCLHCKEAYDVNHGNIK